MMRNGRGGRGLACLALAATVILAAMAAGGCKSGGPGTVVDDAGRSVTLERVPEKIVSMAPSNTEILFAIGVGDKVVGVTSYCTHPPEALAVEKVGDAWNPDYEKIVSLEPDLVLAVGTADSDIVRALENYGLTVFVLQASTLAQVADDIELVGKVTGAEARAAEVAGELRARMRAVGLELSDLGDAERPSVFWVLDSLLWTVGPGSFIDDLIDLAGGYNIGRSLGLAYGQFSMESLLEADPDVIIIPVLDPATPEALAAIDGWDTLTAVVNGRVYQIDPDAVSQPGPRVVDALEQVAALLHPDLFGD